MLKAQVPDGLGGGRGGLPVATALSRPAWPRASLQAKKTYQVYHTESLSAEAKLREAERQEEKRAGRSATATTTSTESGPLRKGSVKKGGRLVEKVGLGGTCLCPKALAPGLCPFTSSTLIGPCREVVCASGKQVWLLGWGTPQARLVDTGGRRTASRSRTAHMLPSLQTQLAKERSQAWGSCLPPILASYSAGRS